MISPQKSLQLLSLFLSSVEFCKCVFSFYRLSFYRRVCLSSAAGRRPEMCLCSPQDNIPLYPNTFDDCVCVSLSLSLSLSLCLCLCVCLCCRRRFLRLRPRCCCSLCCQTLSTGSACLRSTATATGRPSHASPAHVSLLSEPRCGILGNTYSCVRDFCNSVKILW